VNAAVAPKDFWRSRLYVPNYEVGDAARYARVHSNTVSRWHKDTSLADREARAKLSYLQLVELAVVAACREAGMKLPDIRAARAYYAGAFNTKHPFATLKLKTDGVDLALDAGADLLIGNRGGQMAWKSFIGDRFKEFEYEGGLATRWHVAGVSSPIVIDPRIEFGAPSVEGVPTWAVRGRWEAGEAISDIADDFGLKNKQVIAALSFEGVDVAAAPRSAWTH
jgi:uncharacterized protein (DUF433 family)